MKISQQSAQLFGALFRISQFCLSVTFHSCAFGKNTFFFTNSPI